MSQSQSQTLGLGCGQKNLVGGLSGQMEKSTTPLNCLSYIHNKIQYKKGPQIFLSKHSENAKILPSSNDESP